MSSRLLWKSLRDRVATAVGRKRSIGLQHLSLSDRDFDDLQTVLDLLGQQLGVSFELQSHAGAIVLIDIDCVARVAAQQIESFIQGRPVVTIAGLNGDVERLLSAAERLERRQRMLLPQLMDLALVRRASPHWSANGWAPDATGGDESTRLQPSSFASAFDSAFDSSLDGDQLVADELDGPRQVLLQAVLRGKADPFTPVLAASYGTGAHLRFHFDSGLVIIDALALQHLRVRRELPLPAPRAQPHADATHHELDETIWHLGLAAGSFALANEPVDWWHTTLACPPMARIGRYARTPRHLELFRRLLRAPATPAELRRHVRISVADLRRFIQASLLLRLLHWVPMESDFVPLDSASSTKPIKSA